MGKAVLGDDQFAHEVGQRIDPAGFDAQGAGGLDVQAAIPGRGRRLGGGDGCRDALVGDQADAAAQGIGRGRSDAFDQQVAGERVGLGGQGGIAQGDMDDAEIGDGAEYGERVVAAEEAIVVGGVAQGGQALAGGFGRGDRSGVARQKGWQPVRRAFGDGGALPGCGEVAADGARQAGASLFGALRQAAGVGNGVDPVFDRGDAVEQGIEAGAVRTLLKIAEGAEQILGGVEHVAKGGEAEQADRAFHGVQRAERAVDAGGIVGRLLEGEKIGGGGLHQVARLGDKMAKQLVAHKAGFIRRDAGRRWRRESGGRRRRGRCGPSIRCGRGR
jgi:hypothetical protein